MAAAAMALPVGMVAMPSAGAAGGTTCAHTAGTASFKPALPVSGSSQTVKPTITVKKGTVTGCSGGGVTSGKVTSKVKFKDATNCDILLSGKPSKHPPSGTLTTKWNTGATSVGTVTLTPVSGQATQTHVTGTVTSGLFKGLHLSETLQFAPKKGDCLTSPLSQVTFSEVTPITIS